MSEGAVGFIVLLAIAVLFAAVAYRFVRNRVRAAAIAAGAATLTFQAVARWQAGYLDPFFPIAVVVGWAVAFAVALVVGFVPGVRRPRAGGSAR